MATSQDDRGQGSRSWFSLADRQQSKLYPIHVISKSKPIHIISEIRPDQPHGRWNGCSGDVLLDYRPSTTEVSGHHSHFE